MKFNRTLVVPSTVQSLFMMMGITLMGLLISKSLFYSQNSTSFIDITTKDILAAIWFDIVTLSMVFYPFTFFWLLPFKNRTNRIYRLFFRILFLLTNSLAIGINLMDVIYFQFTSKRSTFDLFSMVGYENDMNRLWEVFARDFWWLILVFCIIIWLCDKLFNRIYTNQLVLKKTPSYSTQTIALLLLAPFFIILGRGGFGYKPLSVVNVAQYTRPENTAFVINTAFTMLKSLNETGLEQVDFLPEEETYNHFSPYRTIEKSDSLLLDKNTNVVIVILESFGNEWIGPDEKGKTFTPFFDSLCREGVFFTNAFANGKKSIEALPAILASIPGMLDNPYISSRYSSNKINGLGNILKKHNYSTSFFHGATNGSMNFNGFSALVGFDNYYGRSEYDNDDHSDGTWGILDHHFLPWMVEQLNSEKQPFASVLFTLSSHHPYRVPDEFREKLPKGPHPICQTIAYTDYSLRLFFEKAANETWFKNTLFVFVADHTPSSNNPYYSQRIGMYQIPVLFYTPSSKLPAYTSTDIFQQIDIMPSILDLLPIEETLYSFGQSAFSKTYEPFAITYLEGVYQLFRNDYIFRFTGDNNHKSKQTGKQIFNYKTDFQMQENLFLQNPEKFKEEELFLKSILQRFNNDLRSNNTHIR
jgi:phosphoglycerol transferase MdoB-like AlkP superfamily enzyme